MQKTYPFSDIRQWHYVVPARAATSLTDGLYMVNKTGFFVSVRDVEHPEWRIQFRFEKQMKQWIEIFEQSINESR
jgi:hypothetical protein